MMMMLSGLVMVMWLVFARLLVMEMVTMVIAMVINDADLTSQTHSQSLGNYIYNIKKV